MTISREENQSWFCPRSSMSCNAPTPIASTAKPVQSNFSSVRGAAFGRKISRPVTASTPNGRFT